MIIKIYNNQIDVLERNVKEQWKYPSKQTHTNHNLSIRIELVGGMLYLGYSWVKRNSKQHFKRLIKLNKKNGQLYIDTDDILFLLNKWHAKAKKKNEEIRLWNKRKEQERKLQVEKNSLARKLQAQKRRQHLSQRSRC